MLSILTMVSKAFFKNNYELSLTLSGAKTFGGKDLFPCWFVVGANSFCLLKPQVTSSILTIMTKFFFKDYQEKSLSRAKTSGGKVCFLWEQLKPQVASEVKITNAEHCKWTYINSFKAHE